MTSRFPIAITLAALVVACGPGEKPANDNPVTTATTATPATTTTVGTPTAVPARPDVKIPSEGLALWLAADELAKTGANENEITEWRSPNNMRAVAIGEGRAPRLYANAINGKAAVRFDGENDLLQTNVNIDPEVMPNVTIVAVFNSRVAETETQRKLYGHDNGGYDRAAGIDGRAPTANYTIFGGSQSVVPFFTLEANRTYLTVDSYAPDALNAWVNGEKKVNAVPAKYDSGLPHLYLGGTGPSFDEPWAGDIAEVLVYMRTLSDAERMQVEDYLAAKYGVALVR